jgi:DNA-binding NarL/FixJ family response regulator
MARVLVLSDDLLFGSRLHGSLTAAGHEVELVGNEAALRERLVDRASADPGALVVDLTDESYGGADVLEALAAEGRLGQLRTLAFYSHVDLAARDRASRAGFELSVPRSRIAREAPELLAQLGVG